VALRRHGGLGISRRMHRVVKSILVHYSDQQMFDLVNGVESYPKFIPWCGGAEVRDRHDDGLTAALVIDFHGIKQAFATRNTNQAPNRIDVQLVEGPFQHLVGHWQFKALGDEACKVTFELDYAFSSRTLETLIGPVFTLVANTFIDAFAKRAVQVYGER
jgi:ribosome-associated toxin RatA of RatAB toxin-antitoxin module